MSEWAPSDNDDYRRELEGNILYVRDFGGVGNCFWHVSRGALSAKGDAATIEEAKAMAEATAKKSGRAFIAVVADGLKAEIAELEQRLQDVTGQPPSSDDQRGFDAGRIHARSQMLAALS